MQLLRLMFYFCSATIYMYIFLLGIIIEISLTMLYNYLSLFEPLDYVLAPLTCR